MIIAAYRVEPADFHADNDDLHAVRDAVFVIEQNIPADIEWDERDRHSLHLIARDARHNPIGTGRLTPERRIGRMAVLRAWRGKGVGKSLMLALLAEAQKRGWSDVSLNAQTAVAGFYERFGFVKEGDVFIEAGIPHQSMRLKLQLLAAPARRAESPRQTSVAAIEFDHFDAALNATLTVIRDARRHLCLYTPNLEYPFFGHPDIAAALRQFALHCQDGCARIIVQDTTSAREKSHPVLELAHKLPSSFQFRKPVEPEDQNFISAYVINDRGGYVFRLFSDRCAGVWSPSLPSRNRQLAEEFELCWQRFSPCTEFRVLNI